MARRTTIAKGIAGKVVQRIAISQDPEFHEVDIQFQDRTGLHIEFDVRVEVALESVELLDWKTGDGKLIKKIR